MVRGLHTSCNAFTPLFKPPYSLPLNLPCLLLWFSIISCLVKPFTILIQKIQPESIYLLLEIEYHLSRFQGSKDMKLRCNEIKLVMGQRPFIEHRPDLNIIFRTLNGFECVHRLVIELKHPIFRLQTNGHQTSNIVQPITRFTESSIEQTQAALF